MGGNPTEKFNFWVISHLKKILENESGLKIYNDEYPV